MLTGTFPGAARPGYVYLPPGYSRAHRYPVVYLLHGMPGSPSEYLDGTNLAPFADAAISSGRLRPFIAVLPAAGPDARYNGEWAGPWEQEVVDDVVPFVDAHLATLATPKGRVLAGLSAGGFGAVYIALRHPGVFGSVESWSGYFHPLRDGPFKQRHEGGAARRRSTRARPGGGSVAAHGRYALLPLERPVPLALVQAGGDARIRGDAAPARPAGAHAVHVEPEGRVADAVRRRSDVGVTRAVTRRRR